MALIFEFSRSYVILAIWQPRSGVRIYQIVTGVTSDVGMPSTHLVCPGDGSPPVGRDAFTWTPAGLLNLRNNFNWIFNRSVTILFEWKTFDNVSPFVQVNVFPPFIPGYSPVPNKVIIQWIAQVCIADDSATSLSQPLSATTHVSLWNRFPLWKLHTFRVTRTVYEKFGGDIKGQ